MVKFRFKKTHLIHQPFGTRAPTYVREAHYGQYLSDTSPTVINAFIMGGDMYRELGQPEELTVSVTDEKPQEPTGIAFTDLTVMNNPWSRQAVYRDNRDTPDGSWRNYRHQLSLCERDFIRLGESQKLCVAVGRG